MPKFSIIVNCLNGEDFINRSLDSIYNQTFKDWEIIFYDNNSTDNSAEIAKSYGKKLKYFKSEKTFPLGRARYDALRLASGEFIAYLDVDDVWKENKLEVQNSILMNDLISFTFTNTLITDDQGYSFELFKYSHPERGHIFKELLKRDFIPTSSIAIKQSAILQLDQTYEHSLTLECDRDFILRLSNQFECDYTEMCLTERFIHSDNTIYKENHASLHELDFLKDKISKIASNSSIETKVIERFVANIDEKIARSYWNIGEKKKARKIFKQHIDFNRHKLLFLLTFILPQRINMQALSSWIRKVRRVK